VLKVTVPDAPAVTVAVSVSVWPRLKFVDVAEKVILCVALPTLIVFDPAAVRLVKLVESVGTKSAVKTVAEFVALGVQLQVPVVVAATDVHPVIPVPPDLKVTAPGLLTVAVIITAVPKVAVKTLAGKAKESVGATLLIMTAPDT
jgi:hypothetical protein